MILVSGGSGLVGSYLLRELVKKGEKVRALYRTEKSLERAKLVFNAYDEMSLFEKIEWFKADLLDLPILEESFKGINKVYHCAAVVSFKKGDANSLTETNIEVTSNMVNLALEHSIEKFCFVSSVAALGKYRDGSCADENTLWQKEEHTSDYSISKFYSENEVWRAAEEGLNMVIVNPSTIIGFGDIEQSSNTIFKRVKDGLSVYPPGSTGFVAVEDVVEAMIRLMESDISNQRFVLSSENVSFQKLFNWMAKSLGKKAPRIALKKWQAVHYLYLQNFLALISFRPSAISMANIHSAFNKRCFDNSRIKEAVGIEFRSIEKAVDQSGELYRKFY